MDYILGGGILALVAIAVYLAGQVRDLWNVINSETATLRGVRDDLATLGRSVSSLKSDLGLTPFGNFELRVARYRNITELDDKLTALAAAAGFVYEPSRSTPPKFVKKGGPERE